MYMLVLPVSLLACIFSCVFIQVQVERKTPELHARNYIRVCLASKFIGVHILSHVITSTRATLEPPKECY